MGKFLRGLGSTIKWLLIIGVTLIVVVIIVALFSLGNAASDSDSSSNQVTRSEYNSIKNGMSESKVAQIIGSDPESKDNTEVNGSTFNCIYYGVLADNTYQFCFSDDKLTTKSIY